MKQLLAVDSPAEQETFLASQEKSSFSIALPEAIGEDTSRQLMRMFRDPRVLEPQERKELVAQLRKTAELAPQIAEVKVLLGMALSVDLQAQEALEVLRTAAQQAPDSFIARLKFGELLMRLRICRQAEEETHQAALLAANAAQSEMARRQATTIRIMLREGVERGGYKSLLPRIFYSRRKSGKQNSSPALAVAK
jgi:hypothetical protein